MINKEKNQSVQITLPKETVEKLDVVVNAFNKEDVRVTRSLVLKKAFDEYCKALVAADLVNKED